MGLTRAETTTSAAAVRLYRPLWAGLRELGHIDGRNIRLERRYAEGVLTRLPALAAELVALKPDLIIAATALHHGLTIVSRDTSEYERANAAVLNPWTGR